jgi:dihydroxyacid dehydratase/phosphogluconate dehydratase
VKQVLDYNLTGSKAKALGDKVSMFTEGRETGPSQAVICHVTPDAPIACKLAEFCK